MQSLLEDAINESGIEDLMGDSGLNRSEKQRNFDDVKSVIITILNKTVFHPSTQSQFRTMHLFKRFENQLQNHQNEIFRTLDVQFDERAVQRQLNEIKRDIQKSRRTERYGGSEDPEEHQALLRQAEENAKTEASRRKRFAADEIGNSFHGFIGFHLAKTTLTELVRKGLAQEDIGQIHTEPTDHSQDQENERCGNILLCLYSMVTRGAQIVVQNSVWGNMADSSAIFIDEFEDFFPEEILLLSMDAHPELNCVTIAGDDLQDTQHGDTEGSEAFFSFWKKKEEIFLDRNFRQRQSLGQVTTSFRELIATGATEPEEYENSFPIFPYEDIQTVTDDIIQLVNALHLDASVALVVADDDEVALWHERLVGHSQKLRRQIKASKDKDLISRIPLHIASADSVKGLQFNAVLIPDLSQFALTERHLYVAITRAKDALYLANPIDSNLTECMNILNENGIIQMQTSRPTLDTE